MAIASITRTGSSLIAANDLERGVAMTQATAAAGLPVIDRVPRTLRGADLGAAAIVRTALFMLAGALPVSSIVLFVLGWLPMWAAASFLVLPFAVVTVVLIAAGSPEAVWAGRGIMAGLAAVFCYDAVRMPLVWLNVWPDFIPRIGGWVVGTDRSNVVVGYAWRYVGDGAGIGMAYFVFCGVLLTVFPRVIAARPVAISIGYGVFVWSGLLATVVLPARGEQLLFRLTPASFALSLLGHLIYGGVLGLILRRYVADHRSTQAN
jgi:hypothetical protein